MSDMIMAAFMRMIHDDTDDDYTGTVDDEHVNSS